MNNRVLAVTASLFLTLTMIAGDTAYAASKAGAQLTGSVDRSKGFNRLFSVEPVAVDGKSGFQFSTLGSYLKVPAGKHQFTLHARIGRGFLQAVGTSSITVTATLQAGRRYRAMGEISNERVSAWIV